MPVVHRTKKAAESERMKKRSPDAFATIYHGPDSGRKVGWVVQSRIRGKRSKR